MFIIIRHVSFIKKRKSEKYRLKYSSIIQSQIFFLNVKKYLHIFSVFGGTGTTAFGAQQNKPAFGGSTFGSTAGGGGK